MVVKYDRLGNVLWSFVGGGTCRERATAVAIDSSLNITIAGESVRILAGQTLQIGHYNLTAQGNNAFVFRLSKDGALGWLVPAISPSATMEGGLKVIAADTTGCVVFVGGFGSQIQLGAFTLTTNTSSKYLAKVSPSGEVLWLKLWSTNYASYPIELTTDRHNNIIVGCELRANWSIDDSSFIWAGEYDLAIVRLTPDGSVTRSWHYGQSGRETLDGIGVDNSDNIYVIGQYWNPFMIGGVELPVSPNYASRFLMRLDAGGEIKWVKPIGLHTYYLGGITVDRFGNTTVAMNFNDTIDLIDTKVISIGSWDVIFAAYDDQGNRLWFVRAGDTKWDTAWSLSTDGFGHTYFTGYYYEKSRFGPIALNTSSNFAAFVGRISVPLIVTTSPEVLEYCPGDSITIRFSTTVPHTLGNQFFAYLSDSSGKFDSLILIGKMNGLKDSVMKARIPLDTKSGDRYRVRVSSTLQKQEGLDRGPYFTVRPLPKIEIQARKPVDFCEGNTVPLLASGGVSYRWSTGDTTAAVEIGKPGWHYVTVENEFGCESRDSIKLTSYPYPVASVTAGGPTTFCQGGQVTLTAKGGKSYVWSNGEKTASIVVKQSGDYSVIVKGEDCTDESEKLTVTVHPTPAKPMITFHDDTLYSSSTYGNEWYLAGGSQVDTAQQFVPKKSGKYYVRFTDSNGCVVQSEFLDVEVEQSNVELVQIHALEVSPNPVDDKLRISLSASAPLKIEIFDELGVSRYTGPTVFTSELTLDVKDWSNGSYVVRVSADGKTETRKFIKR